MRLALTLATTALTAGCVAPVTKTTPLSRADLEREQLAQQRYSIESDWRLQDRLDSIALPFLKAAVPFCGERVALRMGIRTQTAMDFTPQWRAAARESGLSDTLTVVGVTPGTAAWNAGIRRGDRIIELADAPLPSGTAGSRAYAQRLTGIVRPAKVAAAPTRAQLVQGQSAVPEFPTATVNLAVLQEDGVRRLSLPMDTVCAIGVVAQRSAEPNAFADGKNIYITSAMMRFATDSGELETVIAHEVAHNAMRHIDAKMKNATIGAIFGAVLDIAAASQGVNTGGEYTGMMANAAAMSFSQDFEREADYIGMYLLARTGYSVTHSANLWRKMAVESPGSIRFASSHPTSAERYIRLRQYAEEIERKRSQGLPLTPEVSTSPPRRQR